jgi:hypothetical protein
MAPASRPPLGPSLVLGVVKPPPWGHWKIFSIRRTFEIILFFLIYEIILLLCMSCMNLDRVSIN